MRATSRAITRETARKRPAIARRAFRLVHHLQEHHQSYGDPSHVDSEDSLHCLIPEIEPALNLSDPNNGVAMNSLWGSLLRNIP